MCDNVYTHSSLKNAGKWLIKQVVAVLLSTKKVHGTFQHEIMQLNLVEDYHLQVCVPPGLCSWDAVMRLHCHIINSSYYNHDLYSKLYRSINSDAVDIWPPNPTLEIKYKKCKNV